MDELIIDEKKYISSKQAAKLTGYAKDYVGQLCREGRVPAQLVGRSWYVLESAMLDHRFGTESAERESAVPERKVPDTIFGWRAPRYEHALDEALPIVEKAPAEASEAFVTADVHDEAPEDESAAVEAVREPAEVAFDMQPRNAEDDTVEAPEHQEGWSEEEEPGEMVQITRTEPSEEAYEAPVTARVSSRTRRHRAKRVAYTTLRALLAVCAVMSLALACANSGYFDAQLVSASRVHEIVGISVYKK